MDKELSVKIYVPYELDEIRIRTDIITPIHVGRQLASSKICKQLSDIIGDDTGDNISSKYNSYGNFALLYWLWKNSKEDYVGVFSYTNFLNLNRKSKLTQTYFFDDETIKEIGLSDNNIKKLCKNAELIIPPYKKGAISNNEYIENEVDIHYLNLIKNLFLEHFTDYADSLKNYFDSNILLAKDIFIMKKNEFNQFSNFVFSFINKLEIMHTPTKEEYKILYKILLNIYVNSALLRKNKIIKTKHVTTMYNDFVELPININSIELGEKIYNKKTTECPQKIHIAFSVNDYYVRHTAAALASILLNSEKGNDFNVYILDGGNISDTNKKRLSKLKKIRDFSIDYIKVDAEQLKSLPLNRSYVSIETYFRLLLPDVLPNNVEKLIYLDSDIIVEGDIADLWNYDISEYNIAAVQDENGAWLNEKLNLPKQNGYFNAGVQLLNIKKLRENQFSKRWSEYFNRNKAIIEFQDQDIMNGLLTGTCLFIPLSWNANTRLYSYNDLIPSFSSQERYYAAMHPKIIHYTGDDKPWHRQSTHPLKYEYIKYLGYTDWKKEYIKLFISYILNRISGKYNNESPSLDSEKYINKNDLPKSYRLEASTICQLKCPLCYMRTKYNDCGIGYLKFKDFKRFVDKNIVTDIELSNSGEIFLNPELIKIIKYAYKKNINLTAYNGVNFNDVSEEVLEALVKYNFKSIIVSIDGASQETYEKYRVRGNFEKVISNIKKINFYKSKYNSIFPKMIWKMILFGHCEHEISKAKEMARQLNMEIVFSTNWDEDTYSPLSDKNKIKKELSNDILHDSGNPDDAVDYCKQLWDSPQINYDGRLLGCCCISNDDFETDVFNKDLIKVFNSPRLVYTRRMLKNKAPENEDIYCVNCPFYERLKKNNKWIQN